MTDTKCSFCDEPHETDGDIMVRRTDGQPCICEDCVREAVAIIVREHKDRTRNLKPMEAA